MVSGTDCHGTPTEVKALKENKSPKELVDECHVSFDKDFGDFGISFDLYNRTDDEYHKKFVQEQFVKYYKNGYLEEKEEELEIELDELQRKAVMGTVKNGLFILSGGPGTGKTTTINTMIRYFEKMRISRKGFSVEIHFYV